MDHKGDGSEIVFFDVETTIPYLPNQAYAILEFGAILVCPSNLTELQNYSTLVRPANPFLISTRSIRCNGITREDVASAPTFSDIAERVWAGHNISRFDGARIREAFNEINRAPPQPKSMIDSLPLLTRTFGPRAGNMKMASLAKYFDIGQQAHRSLDDVRMNLEIIKNCATVLFLESNFPDVYTVNGRVSPNASNIGKSSVPDGGSSVMKMEAMLVSPAMNEYCKEGKKRAKTCITSCSSEEGSAANKLGGSDN